MYNSSLARHFTSATSVCDASTSRVSCQRGREILFASYAFKIEFSVSICKRCKEANLAVAFRRPFPRHANAYPAVDTIILFMKILQKVCAIIAFKTCISSRIHCKFFVRFATVRPGALALRFFSPRLECSSSSFFSFLLSLSIICASVAWLVVVVAVALESFASPASCTTSIQLIGTKSAVRRTFATRGDADRLSVLIRCACVFALPRSRLLSPDKTECVSGFFYLHMQIAAYYSAL